jgi:hypothetical protein
VSTVYRKEQAKAVPFKLPNGSVVSIYDVPLKALAHMAPADLMAAAATGASELLAIELASQVHPHFLILHHQILAVNRYISLHKPHSCQALDYLLQLQGLERFVNCSTMHVSCCKALMYPLSSGQCR